LPSGQDVHDLARLARLLLELLLDQLLDLLLDRLLLLGACSSRRPPSASAGKFFP
jgi:hypothetical protein